MIGIILDRGSKAVSREVNLELTMLGNYYSRLIGKVKGASKINVRIFDQRNGGTEGIVGPDRVMPICSVHVTHEVDELIELPEPERTKVISRITADALRQLTFRLPLTAEQINEAEKTVASTGYKNAHFIGPVKYSRKGKVGGQIHLRFEKHGAVASVVFTRPDKTTRVVDLFTFLPDYYFISPIISKGKWMDEDVFRVSDKAGEINFEASVNSGTSWTVFEPKKQGLLELEISLELSRYRGEGW